MRTALTFSLHNVCVCRPPPFDSIGSNGQKEVSTIKIDQGGPEIWKKNNFHPNHLRGGFGLNLSKKVKGHLFCINLDTGYLLYVVLWIPKAFSLLTHHPRVVCTICKKEFLDTIIYSFLLCKIWFFFKIKNIYIDSDTSTSNSQVYHYFEKKRLFI